MKNIHFFCVVLFIASSSFAAPELIGFREGICLPDAGNCDLWYGCSPTSAGMLLGWYDRNGFPDLVPGGEAETCTFGVIDAIINNSIASTQHISDYFSAGYGGSKDDVDTTKRSFNCLADFMGTSQDAYGNSNGLTYFTFYSDNSPCMAEELYNLGPDAYGRDGMYGISEYIDYVGYSTANLYNQLVYGFNGNSAGFSFDQYKAEIDAGRGVLIHLKNDQANVGHTMYGYGYDVIDGNDTIYVYDTLGPAGQNPGTLIWGDSYFYDDIPLAHYGVTVLEIIPEPAAILLLSLGIVFLNKSRHSSQ